MVHAVLPTLQLVEAGIKQSMQVQTQVEKVHLHRFLSCFYASARRSGSGLDRKSRLHHFTGSISPGRQVLSNQD